MNKTYLENEIRRILSEIPENLIKMVIEEYN